MTKEEKILLKRINKGALDGVVGDDFITSGKSTVWKVIKNGIPTQFKQGPGTKFFNNKETVKVDGVLHTMREWITDEEKLQFLQKFGWLMKDAAVQSYSAKFKPGK